MNSPITINGLTWVRREESYYDAVEPVWALDWAGGTLLGLKNYGTLLDLKNYDNKGKESCRGTVLISGSGPFPAAGRYASVEEAMNSSVLAIYVLDLMEERIEKYRREAAELDRNADLVRAALYPLEG